MKKPLYLLALIILISCTEEVIIDDFESNIYNVTYGSCKANTWQTEDSSVTRIMWNYDAGNLHIQHINAAFNCCPGELNAKASFRADSIEITESQEEAGCRCECLYDLSYSISNLNKGVYHIQINEPLIYEDKDKIKFRIDLNNETSGEITLIRENYPW